MKVRGGGALALLVGLALVLAPRVWHLNDPFGDRARVAWLTGGSLVLIGALALLGLGNVGQGLSGRQAGGVLIGTGTALSAVGLSVASLYPKTLGGPMLPVWVGGGCLLAVGLVRTRTAKR